MFPYLLHGNNGLAKDDIAGIQALYGRPQINPSTTTSPTPPSGKIISIQIRICLTNHNFIVLILQYIYVDV